MSTLMKPLPSSYQGMGDSGPVKAGWNHPAILDLEPQRAAESPAGVDRLKPA